MNRFIALVLLATTTMSASAGEADVRDVLVSCSADSICRFDVTVKHDDEGWEHYANRWEILSPDGEILVTRELAHPHDNEQPFTRSLTNVAIPSSLLEVIVRAHDLKHGYGGQEIVVKLPNQNTKE